MQLADIISTLPHPLISDQPWAIVGPEAEAFRSRLDNPGQLIALNQNQCVPETIAQLRCMVLAGALSAEVEQPGEVTEVWLRQMSTTLPSSATLVVIEWQADGPPQPGPDMSHRFKLGRLRRVLRETGFGIIKVLTSRPVYYIVQAIKEAPPPDGSDKFVPVATLDELPKNKMKRVELFGQLIVVANTGREIVAFAQTCPHANASLAEGFLRGRNVVCPRHGYIWNVRSGQPIHPADEDILPRYAVEIDEANGQISVALGDRL